MLHLGSCFFSHQCTRVYKTGEITGLWGSRGNRLGWAEVTFDPLVSVGQEREDPDCLRPIRWSCTLLKVFEKSTNTSLTMHHAAASVQHHPNPYGVCMQTDGGSACSQTSSRSWERTSLSKITLWKTVQDASLLRNCVLILCANAGWKCGMAVIGSCFMYGCH